MTADKIKILRVLLPLPIDQTYDYLESAYAKTSEGSYVEVFFGPRKLIGVVWSVHYESAQQKFVSAKGKAIQLKAISNTLDIPPMPKTLRDFIDRSSNYTMSFKGMVLKMALSGSALSKKQKSTILVKASSHLPNKKLTPQQQKVADCMQNYNALPIKELQEKSGASASVLKTMIQKNLLITQEIHTWQQRKLIKDIKSNALLSSAQQGAANELVQKIDQKPHQFSCTLLDGVTGSGKTEVYFEAIAKAIELNQQVLILLPEIALSEPLVQRFKKRFGITPDLWHSDLSQQKRRQTWRQIACNLSRIVIGARSALFLPYQNLGLIIVDEEHESNYKQEEGVLYQARDMAILRAHMSQIPIFLVSATPSLETFHNVKQSKYHKVHLPSRHNEALLPQINVIDLKEHKPPSQHFISPLLKEAMHNTLARGEQVLLYLNRRGYAPLTLCRSCGHKFNCPNCTTWLIEHKSTHQLKCHHCDFVIPIPKHCPQCKKEGELVPCGPGVERIAEEAKKLFPGHHIGILTSDVINSPTKLTQILEDIEKQAVHIMIGTQLIAKGHHFPMLTLVGVIDADMGLMGGDLRASERTYQLLHQVSGRAGREERPGQVYIQTHYPEQPILEAMMCDERDAFLDYELEMREQGNLPPYYRLAALIVSSEKEELLHEFVKEMSRIRPNHQFCDAQNISILGPISAPIYVIRNRHRMRFLIKAPKNLKIQDLIASWLSPLQIPQQIRVQIDIDPYSFL